jgi:N-acetylglutamate synthase-like GNAT family acetyltransferase
MELKLGEFTVTDRREDLDIETIHHFLRESYWAKGIPRSIVEKAINNSLCFGLYHNSIQIGFGRAVSDRATFAYLADVFVLPAYRGRGLGKWLVSCVLAHPELQGLRRWLLATLDAHGLYESNGFSALQKPERFMEINDPDIYQGKANNTGFDSLTATDPLTGQALNSNDLSL